MNCVWLSERTERMDLSKLSLKELREIAKEKGLSGVSGLRKADLVHELEKLTRSDARTAVPSEEYQKRERTAKRAEGNAVQTTEKEEKKKQTYTYVPNHGDRGHTRNSNASIHRSENRQDNHLEQQAASYHRGCGEGGADYYCQGPSGIRCSSQGDQRAGQWHHKKRNFGDYAGGIRFYPLR